MMSFVFILRDIQKVTNLIFYQKQNALSVMVTTVFSLS